MNFRQIIILLAGTIAIVFENGNAEEETSTKAFEHAFISLSVPPNRPYEKSRGIIYDYLDHLYSAALAVYDHVFIEEPITFCKLNINEFHIVINDDLMSVCTKLMNSAGYTEYTNAKKPRDFCNGYKPNEPKIPVQIVKQFVVDPIQQHCQPTSQQNERFMFNPIQPPQPLPTQRTEHFVYDSNQQNHQPPALRTENVVLDSSSHQLEQESQKYKHHSIDLNQQPSVSSPPIYSDEHFSLHDNHVGTSTSYMEYGKSLGFDLNKSPPK